MATGALLAQTVGLADGGIEINGQRSVAWSGPSGPGPGQQLPAHPVQLPDMTPAEAAQEGAQSGRCLDHAADGGGRPAGTQRISVVDAVATGQSGGHQRHQFVAGVGPAREISQVNVKVHQFAQTQAQGQGGRQDQPGVGHQAVIIEGDTDAVWMVAW